MSDKQYVNELHKIIEEGDTLLLDNYLEDNDSGFIISDFGQILNEIADILSNLSDDPTQKQTKKYAKALSILLDY